MPSVKIPIYQQQTTPEGTVQVRAQSPDMPDYYGPAFNKLSAGMKELGVALKEREEGDELLKAHQLYTDNKLKLIQSLPEKLNEMPPDAAGYADYVIKTVGDVQAQAMAGIQSPKVKAWAMNAYNNMKLSFAHEAVGKQSLRAAQWQDEQLDQYTNNFTKLAAQARTPEEYEALEDDLKTYFDESKRVAPARRLEKATKAMNAGALSYAEFKAASDPVTIIGMTNKALGIPQKGQLDLVTPRVSASGNFVDRMAAALKGHESGDNYNAANPDSNAAGAYQIMPKNWGPWAKEAGLPANSPMTPENQDTVAKYKIKQYAEKFGERPDVIASAWYSGPDSKATKALLAGDINNKSLIVKQSYNGKAYPSIGDYAKKVAANVVVEDKNNVPQPGQVEAISLPETHSGTGDAVLDKLSPHDLLKIRNSAVTQLKASFNELKNQREDMLKNGFIPTPAMNVAAYNTAGIIGGGAVRDLQDQDQKYNINYRDKMRDKDPFFGSGVQSITVQDTQIPGAISQKLDNMRNVGQKIAAERSLQYTPVMDAASVKTYANQLTSPAAGPKALSDFQIITSGKFTDADRAALVGQLSMAEPDNPVAAAIASQMYDGKQSTAVKIWAGNNLLNDKTKKFKAPDEPELRKEFDSLVGDVFKLDPGVKWSMYYAGFKSIYADEASTAMIAEGKVDRSVAKKALQQMLPPIEKVNGHMTMLQNGLTPDSMESQIGAIRATDIDSYGGVGYLDNNNKFVQMPSEDAAKILRDNGRFVAAGGGYYKVYVRNQNYFVSRGGDWDNFPWEAMNEPPEQTDRTSSVYSGVGNGAWMPIVSPDGKPLYVRFRNGN